MERQNYMAKRRVLLDKCFGVAPGKSVLTGPQILEDWFLESKTALKSVKGKTMAFWPDEIGMRVLGMFQKLPKNLKKELEIDSFSKLTSQFGDIDLLRRQLPLAGRRYRRYEQARAAFFSLFKGAGATIDFTNPPKGLLDKLMPFRNRDHGKYLSVDDNVFYLTDFNLFSGNTETISFGIKFVGEEARTIIQALEEIKTKPLKENRKVQISEHTWFHIDCGNNHSGIMDEALQNSTQANSCLQRLSLSKPDGAMGQIFEQAQGRGVKTETITGTDEFQKRLPITIPQLVWFASQMAGFKRFVFGSKSQVLTYPFSFVHSKLLLFDGRKAIFGSHNFDDKGPLFNTIEYAIVTEDPEIISVLRTKLADLKTECNPQIVWVI